MSGNLDSTLTRTILNRADAGIWNLPLPEMPSGIPGCTFGRTSPVLRGAKRPTAQTPRGSIVKPQLLDGRKFDTVVDTVGTHLLALRVEDESRACAVQTISFLSTANIPYQVHIEDLRQEFKLKELTSYLDRIQGRESWKYSRGEGVVIAIIDSGLNYNHPLVAHNVKINEGEIPGNGLDDDQNGYVDDYTGFDFYHNDAYPFDDGGHGSQVAGLAASAIGLAQNAQVLPIKVSAFKKFDIGTLISAMYYAVDSGAHIINISLSIESSSRLKREVREVIQYAEWAGVLIVASVGNEGRLNQRLFPASFPSNNIISVAASRKDGSLASYSNYGPGVVDISAPGGEKSERLQSLYMYNPEEYLFSNKFGTSLAAPLVAGVAAQILSINPLLKPEEVIEIIMSTGDEHPDLKGKVKSGRNLNALSAVKAARETLAAVAAAVPSGEPKPPPEAIREAQVLLNALGYRPGPADGVWGPRTGDAYRAFLRDSGMPSGEMFGLDALLAMRKIAVEKGIEVQID